MDVLFIACIRTFQLLFSFPDEFGEINPEPTDQTAVAGELAFFQCQYSMGSLLPTWLINGVEHIPSDLPAGHWINSSGLVVSAEVGRNGTSYQCQFNVFISSLNGFITRTSNMPAYLTVTIPDGEINAHTHTL